MTYQHILYEVSDKIATITLNRPDRMNAWTPIMERDVRHAMETASRRRQCPRHRADRRGPRVLRRRRHGGAEGARSQRRSGAPRALPPFDMNRRPDWQTRYAYYPSIPKPVIGMLNGATAGIGLVHALYCDLRFAADNTVFTTAFARRGLIAEHGISWMLPRIVGHANALDLLMSARRVSSDEALRIGLVNRLYPPDQLREQTYAYARDLADFVSPSAIAVIKRQLYDVPFQTLAEATIDANREMQVALKRQRFPGGRGEFHGEAAAEVYGEVRGRLAVELAEARRRPSGYGGAAFALRSMAGLPSRSGEAAKAGGARRDRTADLVIANDALSQLSYGPVAAAS